MPRFAIGQNHRAVTPTVQPSLHFRLVEHFLRPCKIAMFGVGLLKGGLQGRTCRPGGTRQIEHVLRSAGVSGFAVGTEQCRITAGGHLSRSNGIIKRALGSRKLTRPSLDASSKRLSVRRHLPARA